MQQSLRNAAHLQLLAWYLGLYWSLLQILRIEQWPDDGQERIVFLVRVSSAELTGRQAGRQPYMEREGGVIVCVCWADRLADLPPSVCVGVCGWYGQHLMDQAIRRALKSGNDQNVVSVLVSAEREATTDAIYPSIHLLSIKHPSGGASVFQLLAHSRLRHSQPARVAGGAAHRRAQADGVRLLGARERRGAVLVVVAGARAVGATGQPVGQRAVR